MVAGDRGAGRRLGKYTLLRRIGRGGMAEVYLARAHGVGDTDRLVAVKLVSSHMADDAAFVAMLQQEARIATSLDHPNIAAVLDFGWSDGEPYLVTEYVHGWSLQEVLRAAANAGSPLPLGCALGILRAVAEALHYAHEARDVEGRPLGVVHRDVSPSNVLVRFDGVVKVVDFGIAKATSLPTATETGTLKGKRGYMSPEQCNGLEIDRRSDVFALGILLFEVTTGYRLFCGDNDFAVMNRIVKGEFVRPSEVMPGYPDALERIVVRALSPRRDARQPDAACIQRELEAFARDERIEVSSLALREALEDLMGARPHPALEHDVTSLPPPAGDTLANAAAATRRITRRSWRWPVFASLLIGGVTTSVVVGHALTSDDAQQADGPEPVASGMPEAAGSAAVPAATRALTTDSPAPPSHADSVAPAPRADPLAPASQAGSVAAALPADPSAAAKEERTSPHRDPPQPTKAPRRRRVTTRSQPSEPATTVAPSTEAPRRPRRTLFPDGG